METSTSCGGELLSDNLSKNDTSTSVEELRRHTGSEDEYSLSPKLGGKKRRKNGFHLMPSLSLQEDSHCTALTVPETPVATEERSRLQACPDRPLKPPAPDCDRTSLAQTSCRHLSLSNVEAPVVSLSLSGSKAESEWRCTTSHLTRDFAACLVEGVEKECRDEEAALPLGFSASTCCGPPPDCAAAADMTCSDCMSCSSSFSGSYAIQENVKVTSQTIQLSDFDENDLNWVPEIVDVPEKATHGDVEREAEMKPAELGKSSSNACTGVSSEEHPKGVQSEGWSQTDNLTPSSSASTNWPAISGISPLPPSDPRNRDHRKHHHHHHHHASKYYHHHRHGHPHHQHHRSAPQKSQSETAAGVFCLPNNALLTSTPIHAGIRLDVMEMSAVKSDVGSEASPYLLYTAELPRFVLTPEILSDFSINSQCSQPVPCSLVGAVASELQPSSGPASSQAPGVEVPSGLDCESEDDNEVLLPSSLTGRVTTSRETRRRKSNTVDEDFFRQFAKGPKLSLSLEDP